MNLQVIQRPFILPFQDNLVTLPFHGQPQVTAVNGVFGSPDVRHEDEFSGFALYRQDESALAAERDACLGPHAGIFNSIHGPAMFLATALRAALGAQPVHPEAIR